MLFKNNNINNQIADVNRLAVKLNKAGESSVIQGHPWIFSNSIVKISKDGKSGDLAIIFSKNKNKVVGVGLFDAASPIRIKMLHSGSGIAINDAFFKTKIEEAFYRRTKLLETKTNSFRLLFGENDGFPGLIADVYDKVLVVKLYSEIWKPYLKTIIDQILIIVHVDAIVMRLSRNLKSSQVYPFNDGDVIYGTLTHDVVTFIEHGVNFSANVIKGHKTGYFLDHRANRRQVGQWSRGKTVLDVFSYAGGFSVHALANDAKAVTSLDISAQALEIAKENALLNEFSGTHHVIVGDAFKALKQLISENKTFDVVVIDPPSFAKQHAEIELAKKKYGQLAELGEKLTAKNGLLVLASCSSRVIAQTFFDINARVLRQSNRMFDVILKTQHDEDHPIGFPEGAYLKCGYYRFLDA